MAKIKTVSANMLSDIINAGDDLNDITVRVELEFHPADISLKMEYMLYFFVYDVHGSLDVPVIIANWDETDVHGISQKLKDDFLGKETQLVIADQEKKIVEKPMSLKLGSLTNHSSNIKRKIEVFATLIPSVGRASKWSEPFEARLVF